MVETLIGLVLMAVVLTPVVGAFTSGLAQNADQSRRYTAYEQARLALERLRVDIHCASGVTSVEQNPYGGFTLTLTQSNELSSKGWCPNVVPAGVASSGVQWCTIPYQGSTTRFVLYRFMGLTASDCNGGAGSTFQVDYLAATPGVWPTNSNAAGVPTSWVGNLWPTASPCRPGELPSVAVDFNVAVDPVGHPGQHYELRDEIGLRNAPRCT